MRSGLSREANFSIKFPELYGIGITKEEFANLNTLCHIHPVHVFLSCFYDLLYIRSPSYTQAYNGPPSFQFPHQNPVSFFPNIRTKLTIPISRRPWCCHSSVLQRAQIMQLFTKESPPVSCYVFPCRPNIIPSNSFINSLSLRSSFEISDQVTHPYKAKGEIIFL